jgi:hypothetical protein
MTDRESNVFRAKLAEQSERFDEMVEYMKTVALAPQVESPLLSDSSWFLVSTPFFLDP